MPRKEWIETIKLAGNTAYRFTEEGIVVLGRLAKIGMSHHEIADYFEVSRPWIEKQIATVEAVGVHFRFNTAEGARELRQSLHDGAVAGDPNLLKFVGERRLKMNKVVEHQHEHQVHVIGTTPNYKLAAEDWQREYAPGHVLEAETVEVGGKRLLESDDVSSGSEAGGVSGQAAGEDGEGGSGERLDG